MSVCIVYVGYTVIPLGVSLLSGTVLAAATVAATSLGLALEETTAENSAANENCVDLDIGNADEVVNGALDAEQLTFSGNGVKLVFQRDAAGKSSVRVSGDRSKAELKRLGEEMAHRLVQQYTYHRLVTEMKAKHMNIVEEEVEEDGTVRMRVRVFQ